MARRAGVRIGIFAVFLWSGAALLAFAAGWFESRPETGGAVAGYALLGMVLLLAAASSVASLFSATVADLIASLFVTAGPGLPGDAKYRDAEQMIARGNVEDGIEAYKAIALRYPRDPAPYLRLVEIALERLDDPGRAQALYSRGMSLLVTARGRHELDRRYRFLVDHHD